MEERQWLMSNRIVMVLVPLIVAAFGLAGVQIWKEAPGDAWVLVLPAAGLSFLLFGFLRIRAGERLALTYFPIWRRRIPWSDIRDAHVVHYDAWRYGGWGIRFSKGTIAYSVWSKQAIRFSVVGRKLAVVVTTKQPQEWLKEMERRSSGAVRPLEAPASTPRSVD